MTSLRRPEELDQLDLSRSAVIEASAGTGKTYLLEHLVLELLITGRARLEEILVVTFTERATAELVTRIRRKIDEALAVSQPGASSRPSATGWTIDAAARARLLEARHSFDQATIATIHAFCQRILTDEPLSTGRLLGQAQVDGRQVFGETFRDVLRRTLTTDDSHRPYLEAYLAVGGSPEALEGLLHRAATARGQWARVYDEERLATALRLLVEVDASNVALKGSLTSLSTNPAAVAKHFGIAAARANELLPRRLWGRFLSYLDGAEQLCEYLGKLEAAPSAMTVLQPLRAVARALLDAAPSLPEAIAQRFLPAVTAELRRRKLTEGLYDFDDMIQAVDEALGGDRGPALVEKLRGRFRFALVDEAQDIEPAQWSIFRRVFLLSDEPRPLMLVGDPKQAIYGFRGADVHTYVTARDEIRARAGGLLTLSRNHRSHREVVDAYNAILDHGATPRYFTDEAVTYEHPVVAAKPPLGDGPGATLVRLEPPADGNTAARIGDIRRALLEAMVQELERLTGDGARSKVSLSEIFVLVRNNAEAREVATRLHRAGIANVLFKPDYIFRSSEAQHVRALLLAMADPTDRARRLAAWLTPFFDVTLTELADGGADPPPEHPLMTRLLAWKALADVHAYDMLWARILDDSGVARRLRLAPSGMRGLTNYRHVFDLLHDEAAAKPTSAEDLATLLAAGLRRLAASDDDTQRLETEADAVRIMTMHAAKGLEADIVFVYGGLTGRRIWRGVHTLQREAVRQLCVGKPKRRETIALIDDTRHQEEQRLLYVAMTRARKHLYLPFFPATESGDLEAENSSDFDPFKRVSGDYLHVSQRLRALAAGAGGSALFRIVDVPLSRPATAGEQTALAAVGRWTPPAALAVAPAPDPAVTALLRTRRRGFVITSYSRLKEARGGYQPPAAEAFDPLAADDTPPRLAPLETLEGLGLGPVASPSADNDAGDALPGGVASGLFLHAVLEKAQLGPLLPLSGWQRQPDVRRLIDGELRRWDRDERHFGAAARLIHAALTVDIPLPDGTILPGLTRATRVRREVDFLFPLPPATPRLPDVESRLVHERGFVRGFLDVLFEQEGRIHFADWKSDVLPAFDQAALRAHVEKNYDWQVRLYTLAVVRMLGIQNAAEHERRFGGLVYLFMRGIAPAAPGAKPGGGSSADGVYVHRPSYQDVQAWTAELAALPIGAR